MRMYRKSFRASYLLGAVKIKDGLFLGDEFSVRDFEFLDVNKITRVINCSGKQIANRNNKAIKFLTFNWVETDKQVLFDAEGNNLKSIREFINEGETNGEGILIHSVKGINRSVCALIAYFMAEYKWSLAKCLEYVTIRRPGLKIQQSFMAQLQSLEIKLKESLEGASSEDWNEKQYINDSEQLVKNTYLNSKTTVTSQAIKRKIFNLNQMKKESLKLRWADHQPGGKLIQYFGQAARKNFKISTYNYQTSHKAGSKGLAGVNYNFQQANQQQNAKDKVQESQSDNNSVVNNEKNIVKKTYIISILKGSKKCFDRVSGTTLSNNEDSENQYKLKAEFRPSSIRISGEDNPNQSNLNSFLQDITNNPEEISEMTQSLSPQKISRAEQNKRIFETNPMSLSDQFNKPHSIQQQQPLAIKNIFKLQQNQIKNSAQIKDSNEQINLKNISNNFQNPKNTLANAYLNFQSSNQAATAVNNQNNSSPTRITKMLNGSIRISNLITENSPEGQYDVPEENVSINMSSGAKQEPTISNFSQQYNRTYNFKRQSQERLGAENADQISVNQDTQNKSSQEIQQKENAMLIDNLQAKTEVMQSELLTSIQLDQSKANQNLTQNAQSNTINQQNSSTAPQGKTLISLKLVSFPKNQAIQFSDGSLRPNTATNLMGPVSININNNPEQAEDPKFSSQRISDYQLGSNNNGMNAFKIAANNVESSRMVYGNRARPSSMDQQNRIFKQLNKKQITNKTSTSINSSQNSILSKQKGIQNNNNNLISINASSINNYFNNNNSNLVKQSQFQYKQAVQAYINSNTINQQVVNSNMGDNNLFKKRIK
ncbi:dual specificity phosphatase domain protein (macronuclear) [Tetrahymena thermophila SB210]|uniref:Dual specificity phosphatase domain protein n=1 Tax=Tetrahymena thermophila (strain SB210) TaxID=312017 RepID=Q22CS3_TETTS|nr:dual specificity phosphatase domain protein [Tetrahymena thermophila SB210]EAR83115.2 dual specificity phosphatase domain protein [Tetrahymena thermophila SB210]|eukprot:XP_001030778.2 dual specificity phosphatase domain protein [Tetrahymena thermophila SB210]